MAVSCNQIERLLRNSLGIPVRCEHALGPMPYLAAGPQPRREAYRVRMHIVLLAGVWTSSQPPEFEEKAYKLEASVQDSPVDQNAVLLSCIRAESSRSEQSDDYMPGSHSYDENSGTPQDRMIRAVNPNPIISVRGLPRDERSGASVHGAMPRCPRTTWTTLGAWGSYGRLHGVEMSTNVWWR